jgi:hypothetical protein
VQEFIRSKKSVKRASTPAANYSSGPASHTRPETKAWCFIQKAKVVIPLRRGALVGVQVTARLSTIPFFSSESRDLLVSTRFIPPGILLHMLARLRARRKAARYALVRRVKVEGPGLEEASIIILLEGFQEGGRAL